MWGGRLAPGSGGFRAGRSYSTDLAEQAEPELGTGHYSDDHEEKADEHQHELPERASMPAEESALVHPVAVCSRRLAVADGAPPNRQAGRSRSRQLRLEPCQALLRFLAGGTASAFGRHWAYRRAHGGWLYRVRPMVSTLMLSNTRPAQ